MKLQVYAHDGAVTDDLRKGIIDPLARIDVDPFGSGSRVRVDIGHGRYATLYCNESQAEIVEALLEARATPPNSACTSAACDPPRT